VHFTAEVNLGCHCLMIEVLAKIISALSLLILETVQADGMFSVGFLLLVYVFAKIPCKVFSHLTTPLCTCIMFTKHCYFDYFIDNQMISIEMPIFVYNIHFMGFESCSPNFNRL